jgi:heterodisulfide reductase subunit C
VAGQIIFIIILIAGVYFFSRNVSKIRRNILLGKPLKRNDRQKERWLTMARVALGQSKMVKRPISGVLHIFVYAGFVIINIEILEILIDGAFGTHRIFGEWTLGTPLMPTYNFLIASFEILALLVLVGCVIFLIRRNILKLHRFWMYEMTKWPRTDANLILITEIALMAAFLTMNATDHILQERGNEHYITVGLFPVSGLMEGFFSGYSDAALVGIERFAWWFHIVFVIAFLNYVPYSKHFHIFLAFPNTYYSNLEPKGKFNNLESVTKEVKLMLGMPEDAPAGEVAGASSDGTASEAAVAEAPPGFGAKDVFDLTWKNLMDAYSCTECGRCTAACPANITGKKLSPRKIMMDTRDRLEEVGRNIDKQKISSGEIPKRMDDIRGDRNLFNYISEEELWACTTCNACVEACPVQIDPLNIIVEMRRYLVMEQSKMPAELQMMQTKIENNGAPWQFSPADRANWMN